MQKKSKIIIFFLIIFTMLLSMSTQIKAYNYEGTIKLALDPISNPDYYKPPELENADSLANIGNALVTLVNIVGTVASVVILLIIGIKYMTGSSEEKANYKQTMIPYIIGAVLLFASSVFVNIIYNIVTNMQS